MVFCERLGHRKFLGRGWTYRFGDGFRAVAFDPGARNITRTGIKHADGGVTFRFRCPFRGCSHAPEAREEKLGEYLAGLAEAGTVRHEEAAGPECGPAAVILLNCSSKFQRGAYAL